jgi:hypothetical protein
MTLPSLVELDLHQIGGYHDEEFVSLPSHSRPLLSHFSVRNSHSHILHGFPFLLDLAVLEISDLPVAKMSDCLQMLRDRDPASNSGWESPIYSLGSPKDSVLKYGDLADAIELGRNRRGTPLDSFEMKWRCHQGDDDDIDLLIPPAFRINHLCFQDLIARGMHISIVSQVGKRSEVWI